MWADGEHAPFRQEDEDEPDNPGAGDDGGKNGADAEEDVHDNVEDGGEGVATFSNEDVI